MLWVLLSYMSLDFLNGKCHGLVRVEGGCESKWRVDRFRLADGDDLMNVPYIYICLLSYLCEKELVIESEKGKMLDEICRFQCVKQINLLRSWWQMLTTYSWSKDTKFLNPLFLDKWHKLNKILSPHQQSHEKYHIQYIKINSFKSSANYDYKSLINSQNGNLMRIRLYKCNSFHYLIQPQ